MEAIIEPVSREVLKKELTRTHFLRETRKGNNEIYCINIHNAPNVLREIGRLREISFRQSGGGTGQALDLDEYDTSEICYEQLIVWSPEDEEIIGGYRFILCRNAITESGIELSTHHYFDFTEQFITHYLPYTIELGRSWVQPEYQPTVNLAKGLYSLDNIWDGLGAIVRKYPEIRYFFGKVTMYPTYATLARDFLLHFMHHYFPDKEQLMKPFHPLEQHYDRAAFDQILDGLDFKDGFKVLNTFVKEQGEFIPPLVNIYMNLSPTMKTFGTAVNPEFGNVEETGILVTLADIYEEKKERHMNY
ncbi:MAG: hemolysin [Bacteroidetes bacterium RIFCSPHIGHO2_02_FULL_44_7]|nr:MAG: hemolysin [Bacteroidetes bacterium RIFCSPHIGHO2_02_FULL_44_7]